MTIKKYYENTEQAEAQVKVTASGQDEKGHYIVLEETIFYPEGGGQPADTGSIGDAAVSDVLTVQGEIRHYVNQPLDTGIYPAQLDWHRRFDHMQQHAGQHVLSAVFADNFSLHTTSFHLGTERVSIDLDAAVIPKEVLVAAEAEANGIICRHIPIETQWVSDEQAKSMPLRKPPAVEGEIRLVKIEGVDINACGGTHPQNTADIGMVKIISVEKAKGGTRVYFLCGGRALSFFSTLIETTDRLVHQLNSPLANLPAAAEALLDEKAAIEKQLKEAHSSLLETEAAGIQPDANTAVATRIYYGRPVKELQHLARLAASREKAGYLFLMTLEGEGARFVCAKGEAAPGDMREVLKELLALTDGKGGGNSGFVQGGGNTVCEKEQFIETFQAAVKKFQEIL